MAQGGAWGAPQALLTAHSAARGSFGGGLLVLVLACPGSERVAALPVGAPARGLAPLRCRRGRAARAERSSCAPAVPAILTPAWLLCNTPYGLQPIPGGLPALSPWVLLPGRGQVRGPGLRSGRGGEARAGGAAGDGCSATMGWWHASRMPFSPKSKLSFPVFPGSEVRPLWFC